MISIALIPVITAFIGWLTNWVAIQMLFHPRQKKSLGPLSLQGLIPKRQGELAAAISQIVEQEIITQHLLREKIDQLDLRPYIDEYAEKVVRHGLAVRLKALPLVGNFINEQTISMVENMAKESMHQEIQPLQHKIGNQLEQHLNIGQIVEDKIRHWNLDKLEAIVKEVAKKEFKTIEAWGAILGFIIGIVQIIILYLSGNLQM